MNISRFFTVFLFVIFLITLTIIIIPEMSIASQPSGEIILHQSEQVAEVGPGEDGIVNFTGEVKVNLTGIGKNVQMVVVSLTIEAPWPASISPTTMSWDPQETDVPKEFEAVVRVPNFTSATRVEEIIINGTIKTYPGALLSNLPSAKGIIRIAEYAMLTVSCWDPYIEALPGESVLFQLKVKNDGNAEASISMEINEIDDMVEQSWTFENDKSNFIIDKSREELVGITVSVPTNALINLNSFDVYTVLRTGDEMDEQVYELFLNITGEENGTNGDGKMKSGGEMAEDEIIPGFELSYLVIGLFIAVLFLHKFVTKFH